VALICDRLPTTDVRQWSGPSELKSHVMSCRPCSSLYVGCAAPTSARQFVVIAGSGRVRLRAPFAVTRPVSRRRIRQVVDQALTRADMGLANRTGVNTPRADRDCLSISPLGDHHRPTTGYMRCSHRHCRANSHLSLDSSIKPILDIRRFRWLG
jgi:hypothetical protein